MAKNWLSTDERDAPDDMGENRKIGHSTMSSLNSNPIRNANMKLDTGPAKATSIMPCKALFPKA